MAKEEGGVRFMQETAAGWVIECRLCRGRFGRRQAGHRVFDTAKEAHDFWREHIQTDLHKKAHEPEDPKAVAEREMLARLFAEPRAASETPDP